MDELLEDIKLSLGINWNDTNTDKRINTYIEDGKAELNEIAGAELDYKVAGLERRLLKDYCRYANSNATEMFKVNFRSELLELNLKYCVKAVGD